MACMGLEIGPARAVEVMDVMDVIQFRMRPDDHGSRPMPEMC